MWKTLSVKNHSQCDNVYEPRATSMAFTDASSNTTQKQKNMNQQTIQQWGPRRTKLARKRGSANDLRQWPSCRLWQKKNELLRLEAARTALEKQLEEDLEKAWLMSFFSDVFKVLVLCMCLILLNLISWNCRKSFFHSSRVLLARLKFLLAARFQNLATSRLGSSWLEE